MTYKEVLSGFFSRGKGKTPQSLPLQEQIPNTAGGYYYAIDPWEHLERFLILGTEAGTYYTTLQALTKEVAGVVIDLLKQDGLEVVKRIVQISTSGRAPKNDTLLFALALATAAPDVETRRAALSALPEVARTGTHILMFADFVNNIRGWGRSLRKGLSNWFLNMPVEKLALQAVKYYQREGWSLRDLLRLAHPKVKDNQELSILIDWIVHPGNQEAIDSARQKFRLIEGKLLAKQVSDVQEAASIIRKYSLPREAVPTDYLNNKEVWNALLVDMPMTALIRNLGKMSQVGLLVPISEASNYVARRLIDEQALKAAKIHPMQILLALRTYAQGAGHLGSLTWIPVPEIVEALDTAFDLTFKNVEQTGKRILVGVDVSGSMSGSRCSGSPVLSCVEVAVAMAMLFVRIEKDIHTMSFDTEFHHLTITRKQRLDDIINSFAEWGGGTDISLPIVYALKNRLNLDAFVIATDNETWAGREHAVQALWEYRKTINPLAKLVVLASSATKGSIIDPKDPLSFGVAGFDASVPELALRFIRQGL